MPREDDVGISNGRLFHHLIDEKRNDFFYAYQCERKVSKYSKQNWDYQQDLSEKKSGYVTNKAELA